MTDEEFIAAENAFMDAMRKFIEQCHEFDISPRDRVEDAVYICLGEDEQ